MMADQIIPPVHSYSRNDSFNRRRYSNEKAVSPRQQPTNPPPFYTAKNLCLRMGTSYGF
jgi:hypothetical protein